MAKILICGGTGLIGRAISKLLLENKHDVVWLSREAGNWQGIEKYKWDWVKKEIDVNAFNGVDVLINLSGAGIVEKAWTNEYKKLILESRIKSSELLLSCIQKNNIHLKTFIGASAVGYYGSELSEALFDETSKPGKDFLSETCVKWENSYHLFQNQTTQLVIYRIGVVLAKNGGALKKMATPFKYGIGSALGSGKQYLPWIHVEDLAQLFLFAINKTEVNGVYNAVSSELINNAQFSKTLAKSMHRAYFLPKVPEFLLKMILGERHVVITRGLKISNQKILKTGFLFKFSYIESALNSIFNSKTI